MNPIGIMQGRLSPAPVGRAQAFPIDSWHREFDDAAACGFDQIQWLVTADTLDVNPLFLPGGIDEINRVIAASGVTVTSLCADCFVSWPLLPAKQPERRRLLDLLTRTIETAANIGVRVIVIPAIENGAATTETDQDTLIAILDDAAAVAARHSMQLALETELDGDRLRHWLDRAASPALSACYDLGNAAALGFDADADIASLGRHLVSVHVKDRRRSGESVPLGDGDADLPRAFRALTEIGFAGPLVLETPVGADPIAAASRHRAIVAEAMHASRPVRK